ncbi:hypothetical protein BCR44DRAFT_1136814 [Catenaria anguillulae PL171]|uniref:Uncharacterized protein n=1 Tax=Catenaria anguillulae PL171 TaxID=765915 RepID=A0A1Y2HJX1_9FUNG|nr:hypothetical protein BCR44DRAFT_1136814 [Catenaria anguillulae PL171]
MDPALTQVHGVDGEGHFSEARIWVGDRDLAEDSNLFRTAEGKLVSRFALARVAHHHWYHLHHEHTVLVQLFSALGEPFTNQNLLPPRAQVEYMLAEQVKLGRESVNIFVELVAQTGSVCLGKRILSGMANFLVCMLQIRNQAPHAALSEPPLVVWDADNLVASLLLLALISGGAADTHLHGLEDAQRSATNTTSGTSIWRPESQRRPPTPMPSPT